MIRLAFAAIVTLSVAATILFSACGDSTFTSSPGTDATADAPSPTGPEASAIDAQPPPPAIDLRCPDAGAHTLCDMFDDASISTFWKGTSPCMDPTLDTSESVSPPQSLSAATKGLTCSSLSVNLDAGTSFSGAFDFRVDKPGAAGIAYFTIEMAVEGRSYYALSFQYTPATSSMMIDEVSTNSDAAAGSSHFHPLSEKFDSGVWLPVSFRFNFASGNLFTTLDNGVEEMTNLSAPPPVGSVMGYTVIVGFPKGPGTAVNEEAHFDNFVCDVTP